MLLLWASHIYLECFPVLLCHPLDLEDLSSSEARLLSKGLELEVVFPPTQVLHTTCSTNIALTCLIMGSVRNIGALFISQGETWKVLPMRNKCGVCEELINAKPHHWHGFHKQSAVALQEALTDLGGKSGRKLGTEPGHPIKGSHFSHLIP